MNDYERTVSKLIETGIVRDVAKGSVIFYQGEVPQSAAILKKGSVKAYNLSPNGEEQLATFHIPLEVFPSAWLFSHSSSTIYFYEAFNDCQVCFLPKRQILDFINRDRTTLQLFLEAYVRNYNGTMLRITALEQAKASAKITYTLFYMSQRYGQVIRDGFSRISLQLTHQQFASLVGLTRETTATEMKKLQRLGVVKYQNQVYEVNNKKLLEHMGDESFSDVQLG